MAISSTSPARSSKKKLSLPKKSKPIPAQIPSSPAKRTKSPGIRVIHGRIYDSENGKTCHQCRQKTMDFVASCKSVVKKPCTIKFCHKCLSNRYGEKAEDMAGLDNWKCPKCRGICNCSFCMKKRGNQPTGILAPTAKATGFSSVSEMLFLQTVPSNDATSDPAKVKPLLLPCSKKLNQKKTVKESNAPSKILIVPTKGIGSKRKHTKASSSAENGGTSKYSCSPVSKLQVDPLPIDDDGKSYTKRLKKKPSKKKKGDNGDNICNQSTENGSLGDSCNAREDVKSGKPAFSAAVKKSEGDNNNKRQDILELQQCSDIPEKQHRKKLIQTKVPIKSEDGAVSVNPNKKKERDLGQAALPVEGEKKGPCGQNIDTVKDKTMPMPKFGKSRLKMRNSSQDGDENVVLPQGDNLKTVAGIELQADDVGPALQFLEFCAAFGKVLDLKKGQPEYVLRELVRGRIGRRELNSSLVQFHLKLLSLIQRDLGEESLSHSRSSGSSWLQALAKCISESQCALKELPLDFLNKGTDGYDKLDPSKKLRVLNFLCDETLGTGDMRSWIDKENSKFVERKKEQKEKVLAAKEKEKDAKRKLKNEVAKIVLSSRNGAPLSVREHEDLISKIKRETEKAHTEKLQALDMLPKKKQRSDAVRTEPVLLDGKGSVYWRLTGCSNMSSIVLQDIRNWDMDSCQEKWFVYDDEQEKALERYVSYLRKKRLGSCTTHATLDLGNNEAGIQDFPSDSSPKSAIEGKKGNFLPQLLAPVRRPLSPQRLQQLES